ncbi:YpoC-like domain-containing protein OS=Ureibacillus acetophenoni OX=614649 GN=SAMN05877842_103294 PE=4 SV=1 [Ureibacillus acetophenoni]
MISFNAANIQKEVVDPLFLEWESLSQQIHQAHDERNGLAHTLMEQGIALYERLIVKTSSDSSEELIEGEDYEVLPLNGKERLSFIKARPGQYACYRQLDELFKETKKRLARLRLKK